MKKRMGFRMLWGALAAFASLMFATPAFADLRVVATIPDLAALAKAVGGDRVSVEALAAAGEDPHYVDPRPSFLPKLSRADAVLVVGLELEIGWLPPLLTNARNPGIQPGGQGYIDASTFVREKQQVPTMKIDRSMGDLHPGGNPHFHTAPGPMAEVALGVGDRFAALDPAHAESYRARARAFAGELRALEAAMVSKFQSLPKERRQIVVFHDSFRYLVAWLQLEQVMAIEEKPGIRPSPGRVATVMTTMRGKGVKAIIQEEWHADGVSRMLEQKVPAKLLKLRGGTPELTGPALLGYLRGLAESIHAAL